MNTESHQLDGYAYGAADIGRSPVTMAELALLERTVSWSAEDERHLRQAGIKLAEQTDAIVAAWREVIAANPHLGAYYASKDGAIDQAYKAKVGARFQQWILDVCRRPRDQIWLDYQHEIGLRHTHLHKNQADRASAVPHIPLRYLIAFTAVINDRIRPFLARDASPDDAAAMHSAWCKAVLLQVTLWSRPYVAESEW